MVRVKHNHALIF